MEIHYIKGITLWLQKYATLMELCYINGILLYYVNEILLCYQNSITGNMSAKQGILYTSHHRCERMIVTAKCKISLTVIKHLETCTKTDITIKPSIFYIHVKKKQIWVPNVKYLSVR